MSENRFKILGVELESSDLLDFSGSQSLVLRAFMQEHLIIFTRYPEPGKAKTRLIPALGVDGAAEFHRRMSEHTIAQAKQLQETRSTVVTVHFAGGDRDQMQEWLGTDLIYQPQQNGDLGDRLIHAFQTAFDQKSEATIAIGTDCPDLDSHLLTDAFELLQVHDLVIGPASDGGYYLIGLRNVVPDVFQNISWSTEIVFQQTLEIAKQLNLSIADLPTLNDIDRPEDLTNLY